MRVILAAVGMPRLTERTITDPQRFLDELALVRERGYAVDNGESEIDGRCVAVPLDSGNRPTAISLSAPASRFALGRAGSVAEALREIVGAVVGELRPSGV